MLAQCVDIYVNSKVDVFVPDLTIDVSGHPRCRFLMSYSNMQHMSRSGNGRSQVDFHVLDCVNHIPGDSYGYYRILADSPRKSIKYLRFPSNPGHQVPDIRGRRLDFGGVPPGTWNCASLGFDPVTQKYHIVSTRTASLPSICKWHDKCVDVSLLGDAVAGPCDDITQCQTKPLSSIRPYTPQVKQYLRPHEPCHDKDANQTMFVDLTWWPSDMYGVEKETYFHSRVRGQHVAPDFLGHVTENHSRVIGYITEHVPGRVAEPSDLDACRRVLAKLHRLGISYGDLSADGFLVANDPCRGVLLHSFAAARETDDKAVFEEELYMLQTVLESDARRKRRERGNRI